MWKEDEFIGALVRTFGLKSFEEALGFITLVSFKAIGLGVYPKLEINPASDGSTTTVLISIPTNDEGKYGELEQRLAAKISDLIAE